MFSDKRALDHYENRLLSWSYVVIGKSVGGYH